MAELKIKNLHVNVRGKEILKELGLKVRQGANDALMGPNASGTGKSVVLTEMRQPSLTTITTPLIICGVLSNSNFI